MTEWFGPTVIVSFLRFGEWKPYPRVAMQIRPRERAGSVSRGDRISAAMRRAVRGEHRLGTDQSRCQLIGGAEKRPHFQMTIHQAYVA